MSSLSFDDYKKLASDNSLESYEKVGFQAMHRRDTEVEISPDIISKLPLLRQRNKTVLDIGCGCSRPVLDLIHHCRHYDQRLILVDSEEMLVNLPDEAHVTKRPHLFPTDADFLQEWHNKADVVISYSVLHAIYEHQSFLMFMDQAVSLLRSGGQMLIGDIANVSKRKRFLSSAEGVAFHRCWSGEDRDPVVIWNEMYEGIDDSVVFHLMQRYRAMGMETYLLPQPEGLPMNRTREDLLVFKW